MEQEKPELVQRPKRKRDFENADQGNHQFIVTDKQQKAGERGYDNDGPFGIGMIKGK